MSSAVQRRMRDRFEWYSLSSLAPQLFSSVVSRLDSIHKHCRGVQQFQFLRQVQTLALRVSLLRDSAAALRTLTLHYVREGNMLLQITSATLKDLAQKAGKILMECAPHPTTKRLADCLRAEHGLLRHIQLHLQRVFPAADPVARRHCRYIRWLYRSWTVRHYQKFPPGRREVIIEATWINPGLWRTIYSKTTLPATEATLQESFQVVHGIIPQQSHACCRMARPFALAQSCRNSTPDLCACQYPCLRFFMRRASPPHGRRASPIMPKVEDKTPSAHRRPRKGRTGEVAFPGLAGPYLFARLSLLPREPSSDGDDLEQVKQPACRMQPVRALSTSTLKRPRMSISERQTRMLYAGIWAQRSSLVSPSRHTVPCRRA